MLLKDGFLLKKVFDPKNQKKVEGMLEEAEESGSEDAVEAVDDDEKKELSSKEHHGYIHI
jgi:hypothetical protein